MPTLLRNVWNATFGKLDRQYLRELDRTFDGSGDTLLDVGCGFNSPIQNIKRKPSYAMGVDAWAPALEQSRSRAIHNDYVQMSVLDIGQRFPPKSFDYVLATELIEHLTAEDGLNLILQMEAIARKRVILTTPNGFLEQDEEWGNPLQKHLSGWTVAQFEAMGYKVIGVEGLWFLRGHMATIVWWPRPFWAIVSVISQYVTTRHPRMAFRLICVKTIDEDVAKTKAA